MAKESQTALITGASRGIGRGIALALAREGFNVVINYARSVNAAQEVKQQAEAAGAKAAIIQADIASSPDRKRLAKEAWDAFGKIDLLVNNAGIAPAVRADLLDASEESFDQLINTNLKGPYFLTQLIARRMIENSGAGSSAKIINITSVSAYAASINRGDYCVAKAGLAMMTQLYALRLAEHGINVYEIRPGIIETDMTGPVKAKYDKLILEDGITPIRRWGKPDDVARAVIAIAKDHLPFSTGEVINVDGGFHLRKL
ncbi:MAG: 3-ketoacyl-ACP reductase [Planctomycetota bacterium]|nr:3-ketoacyl-ACP reductase [Planctomycetota bacterium]